MKKRKFIQTQIDEDLKIHQSEKTEPQMIEPQMIERSSVKRRRVKIKEIKTKKEKIVQSKAAEEGILPEHPFRSYIVGSSGSGKTNYILNLLTEAELYKGYFDDILVISETAKFIDPSYDVLELPDSSFYPCDAEVVNVILGLAKERIQEDGKLRARKILLIFDDFVHLKSFTNCKDLLKLVMQGRHYGISVMLLSQAYHRLPKSLRLNISNLVYFKGSNKELEVLAEDYGPPGFSKREVMAGISDATDERFSFFYVDTNATEGRYRKNLDEDIFVNKPKRQKRSLIQNSRHEQTHAPALTQESPEGL